MNKYLYKFTTITVNQKVKLLDKLILLIINYGSEVWGFSKAEAVERVILTFYKRFLGVNKTTQNYFVYGDIGRRPLISNRYFIIIKFWFQILNCNEH